MPMTPQEVIALGLEAEAVVSFLTKALRKDADGKPRIDRNEAKELVKKLSSLLAHVTRDLLD